MARPPLDPEQRRTKYLRVRLTPAEKRDLERAANEIGVTVAEYARAMLTGKKPKAKSRRDRAMTALLYELSSIATNLGQLADATGEDIYRQWAQYIGGQLVERVTRRDGIADLVEEHLPEINTAGHWVNSLAHRANMGKDFDIYEARDALLAVQKAVQPIHAIVSQPASPEPDPDTNGDAV